MTPNITPSVLHGWKLSIGLIHRTFRVGCSDSFPLSFSTERTDDAAVLGNSSKGIDKPLRTLEMCSLRQRERTGENNQNAVLTCRFYLLCLGIFELFEMFPGNVSSGELTQSQDGVKSQLSSEMQCTRVHVCTFVG
jgi:hypothetical protein